MERVETGSRVLDTALAGGIPLGATLFVSGEEGAGATEFALTLLRRACPPGGKAKARFVSALRSPTRVRRELELLFDAQTAGAIEVAQLPGSVTRAQLQAKASDLHEGDVLVIESADTLAVPGDGFGLLPLWHELADLASERGLIVVLLHAPGTLPPPVEAGLAETADGVLRFTWLDGGPVRRRVLAIHKLRGLAPVLDGDEVPVFEVALQRGVGFSVSLERSVV
jgi:KaiC/GvpD/RAD55 family RecA-like ATPase